MFRAFCLTAIIVLALFGKLKAQNSGIVDSLTRLTDALPEDTAKIRNLSVLIREQMNNRLLSEAESRLRQLQSLSLKLNSKRGLALFTQLTGSYHYYKFNFEESKACFEKAVEMWNQLGDANCVIQCNYSIGTIHFQRGNNYEALRIYKAALANQRKITDQRVLSTINTNLGVILLSQNKYEEALKYLNTAEKISEKHNRRNLITIYNAYATILSNQASTQQALEFMFKTLRVCEEFGDDEGKGVCYSNIGAAYLNLFNYGEATKNNLLALEFSQKAKDRRTEAHIYINLGTICGAQKKFREAYDYFLKGFAIYEAIGSKKGMAESYCMQGEVLMDLNRDYEGAIEKYKQALGIYTVLGNEMGIAKNKLGLGRAYAGRKNFEQAWQCFIESETISKRINFKINLMELYYRMSHSCELQKQYQKALHYFTLHKAYSDSIKNENTSKRLSQIQLMYDFEKKDAAAKANERIQQQEAKKRDAELKMQRTFIYISVAGIITVIGFSVSLYRSLTQNRKKSEIIEKQKMVVEEKQKEILDSINYAKRIQQALLASREMLDAHLENYFVYFKPKDIVSGDFYWAATVSEEAVGLQGNATAAANTSKDSVCFYLAVCDSTGHGVPGAFMSLLNIGFLSEAVKEKNIQDCGAVFNYVRKRLSESISTEGQKDGFDGILLRIDTHSRQITYSAANNSPILISNGQLLELPADKMPVGKGVRDENFSTRTITFRPGDTLYLFTDGYPDQFGGPKGKKFKYSQLEELLLSISNLPLLQQKEVLDTTFHQWKGPLEQIDDVCIVGIRL